MAENKELTFDFKTGTLTDSAGNVVDPATLSAEAKAPEPTVSDLRMKRILKAALHPYYM
jgi:hypothetical protein